MIGGASVVSPLPKIEKKTTACASDSFEFSEEFNLDDGGRTYVERVMERAVHLADVRLRRLTPAGCGIVLDERRLGRRPETVRDLLTAQLRWRIS